MSRSLRPPSSQRIAALVVQGAALGVALALLAAAAQPLFTDDAWWHLALGEAYAEAGPWLPADPLLFTAERAPLPASWLADLAMFGVQRAAGFGGLRVAHAALVLAILVLAAASFRRAGGSARVAALLLLAFVALSAYRLFQLRPELATIAAALLLHRGLLEREEPAGAVRIALCTALLALWANLHAGFLLGPVLIAVACASLLVAAPLRGDLWRSRDLPRLRRLGLALALGSAATLANPSGLAPHLAWITSGSGSPELWRVGDEWVRTRPFALPLSNLPPTPLAWTLLWGLLLAAPAATAFAVARWRRAGPDASTAPDPVHCGLGLVGLAAALVAVRFLWLGFLPLLLLAAAWRSRTPAARAAAYAGPALAAVAALLLAAAFFRFGDWPMISRGVSFRGSRHAAPYPAGKYYAHAVWMLRDAGAEGRIFNDYPQGGFLGWWLAPGIQTFLNGSLNLPAEAMDAARALRERRGLAPGESFTELLDRYRIDLFFGIELPRLPHPNRPWTYTTTHLERVPGWLPVFRDARSALSLRDVPRNRETRERIAAWYAAQGVPFDPAHGFDPERVLRDAPEWAIRHGLAPPHFPALANQVNALDPTGRRNAARELAPLHAALGLYERAIRLDLQLARAEPDAAPPQRRLLWCLLHLRRTADALERAEALPKAIARDPIVAGLVQAAHAVADAERRGDAEGAARIVAGLPVMTPGEAVRLLASLPGPPARTDAPQRSLVRSLRGD